MGKKLKKSIFGKTFYFDSSAEAKKWFVNLQSNVKSYGWVEAKK
tara:strand:+ start:44 stop:175 length:132 start_codon:yes stop_codon:yes gene_type:complete